MLRLIGFLVAVAVFAAGLAWLADRPGELTVQWQGYQIETSVFRAIVLLTAAIVVILAAWAILRHIWHSPAAVGSHLAKRRQKLGLDALSSGMIALGAGDRGAAVRSALQARKSLPNEPLTHLLRAQAAQLSGDRTTARRIFEAMLASPDTEQLGLRGLFLEAQREGETEAARHFAERAVGLNPKLTWAVDALFDLQCRQSDWAGALETLAVARKQGHVERTRADRRRAVLLTAQAQTAEDSDPERALTLALEAHGLAPDLVPAAAIAGRLLASRGNTPRAAKILQRTWSRAQQPDLATAYAYARIGDSPRDRLDRVKQLAALSPNSIEGPIAVATAAIEARQFDEARAALEPLLSGRMTQRVATLMARIEGEQHGDKGRVREWLARAVNAPRDPAWTADGIVADHWAPISPVTGALDAFRWRVPVESMDKGEAEVLAAKLEELVALGGPRAHAGPDAEKPAETITRTAETIEASTVRDAKSVPDTGRPAQRSEPAAAATAPKAAASAKTSPPRPAPVKPAAPAARRTVEPEVATPAASARPKSEPSKSETMSETRRKSDRSTTEPRILVAPTAPDDPGPETAGQDDIAPLRPKPA
jgi:HemY protein